MFMTDICVKSLGTISKNMTANSIDKNAIKLQQFEWGRHEDVPSEIDDQFKHDGFPTSMEGQFDLIIACAVVYLPEAVEPL